MVDYGLFFLATLAQACTPRSIRSIANEYDLSFSFLQKTANFLKRAGLIKAVRGKEGGYTLSKPVSAIMIQDIIEALEGPVAVTECLLPRSARSRRMCPGDALGFGRQRQTCIREPICSVRKGLTRLNEYIKAYTASKTLAEFIS